MSDTTERDLKYELKREVEEWAQRFNYLQLAVLEKYTDNQLIEYIRPEPLDPSDWYNDKRDHEREEIEQEYGAETGDDQNLHANSKFPDEFIEWLKESYSDDIREYMERNGRENYPMWNTLFEFKDYYCDDETLNKIQELGMGVIEHEDFNTIIFMMSCGHSFYGSYWIPLYLALFDSAREKYKGVKYDNL